MGEAKTEIIPSAGVETANLGGTDQPEWMLRNSNAQGAMLANSDQDVIHESRSFFKRLIPRSCIVEGGRTKAESLQGSGKTAITQEKSRKLANAYRWEQAILQTGYCLLPQTCVELHVPSI